MKKPFAVVFGVTTAICGVIICTNILAVSMQPGDLTGVVHLFKSTSSSTDYYTNNPSIAEEQWIAGHYMGMLVYSPYWDNKLSWYPQGYVYDDSYAIYISDSDTISAHPEWILKDSVGNNLYINWNCNGTCPQYAADISNPAYQQAWINNIAAVLALGYQGLFIDDVNMDWRISDGNGNAVCNDGNNSDPCPTVMDANTGQPMTLENWRMYFAQFLQQIRAAFPNTSIIHNSIWYAGGSDGVNDPYIQQQIAASNYQYIEHGVTDGGVTGDGGQYSVQAMQNRIDVIHGLGAAVILGAAGSSIANKEYTAASYFLTSNGYDAVGSSGASDFWDSYWTGFDTNLGTPTSNRYVWNGLICRNFSGGMVLVNPPGSSTQSVFLPGIYLRTDGTQVNVLSLAPKHGAILIFAGTPPVSPRLPAGYAIDSSK